MDCNYECILVNAFVVFFFFSKLLLLFLLFDRTTKEKQYFECDEHLWLLGKGKLPEGITFHIGPDWICLHRDFVEYAVTGTDPLLKGLKEMYQYHRSPVEVRF